MGTAFDPMSEIRSPSRVKLRGSTAFCGPNGNSAVLPERLMQRGFECQDWANPILAESFELKEATASSPTWGKLHHMERRGRRRLPRIGGRAIAGSSNQNYSYCKIRYIGGAAHRFCSESCFLYTQYS
jgi:hypothetical protein